MGTAPQTEVEPGSDFKIEDGDAALPDFAKSTPGNVPEFSDATKEWTPEHQLAEHGASDREQEADFFQSDYA